MIAASTSSDYSNGRAGDLVIVNARPGVRNKVALSVQGAAGADLGEDITGTTCDWADTSRGNETRVTKVHRTCTFTPPTKGRGTGSIDLGSNRLRRLESTVPF
jgi:hypothetical protein